MARHLLDTNHLSPLIAQREMFGLARVKELIARHPGGAGLVPYLLEQQSAFTGPDWEQEDDTTTIILQRMSKMSAVPSVPQTSQAVREERTIMAHATRRAD